MRGTKHRIRGAIWRLLFISSEALHQYVAIEELRTGEVVERLEGLTDSPKTRNKAMRILDTLRCERELRAILHESMHAALWDLDEEAVDETSRDLAKLLYRLGYRRTT